MHIWQLYFLLLWLLLLLLLVLASPKQGEARVGINRKRSCVCITCFLLLLAFLPGWLLV
jgi:hypothetical protein